MNEYKTNFEKLSSELQSRSASNKTLVSKQASPKTRQLFEYLKSIYGKNILAGQQYLQPQELEDPVYYELTGRLPAIRGYDLMDAVRDVRSSDSQIVRAIEWTKKSGCIITLCWHWYAPDNIRDRQNCQWSFYYKTTDYDRRTSFDLLKAVKEGTLEYDFAVSQIDRAAEKLKILESANVPVLWRPLHEASGNWFWWGKRNDCPDECAAAYKKLWYMIFDRMENYHKLTNLIWVWNGQGKEMSVDPNTYDFCGEDIYPETQDHSPQTKIYENLISYTHGKMAALTECGYIPDPKLLREENVKWLWFLPWWGSFVYAMNNDRRPAIAENGRPVYNSERFTPEWLKSVFDDDYVVTLDKLPWFSKENENYIKALMSERFGL